MRNAMLADAAFGGAEDLIGMVNAAGGKDKGISKLRANATTLLPDDWKRIDKVVVEVAQPILVGIQDLRSRPALVDTFDAFSATVLGYNRISDIEDAIHVMELEERGNNDLPQYDQVLIPAPFVSKTFRINSRELVMSRNSGTPLDTSLAALCSTKVAQKLEKTLMVGASSYKAGGAVIYGYADHPNRITGSLGTSWSTETGDNIIIKICAMMQAAINKNHFGPFVLYCPVAYAGPLNKDMGTSKSTPIIERIRQLDGIDDVKFSTNLTTDNVVMVEMSPATIQLAVGLDITNIPWNTPVGSLNMIVAACMIPKIIVDQNSQTGIVHYS